MAKKTSFNMLFNETQQEILEYVIDDLYSADMPKALFIHSLIRESACDILSLTDEDRDGLSDEMILIMLKHNNDQKQLRIIDMVGVEKYRETIEEWKTTIPDYDPTYCEALLEKYLKNRSEKNE